MPVSALLMDRGIYYVWTTMRRSFMLMWCVCLWYEIITSEDCSWLVQVNARSSAHWRRVIKRSPAQTSWHDTSAGMTVQSHSRATSARWDLLAQTTGTCTSTDTTTTTTTTTTNASRLAADGHLHVAPAVKHWRPSRFHSYSQGASSRGPAYFSTPVCFTSSKIYYMHNVALIGTCIKRS